MAFVDMHIFSRDFLHFDMSLLLLIFTLRGYLISIAYCLFFHLFFFSTDVSMNLHVFYLQDTKIVTTQVCITFEN